MTDKIGERYKQSYYFWTPKANYIRSKKLGPVRPLANSPSPETAIR